MKLHLSSRLPLLLSLVSVWLLTAAAPLPSPAQVESPEYVRLIVNNRNTKPLVVRLVGPTGYQFTIRGEDIEYYTVRPGQYKYWATACGVTVTGSLDLSRNRVLVMTVCGGSAGPSASQQTKEDLTKKIKVMRVAIENRTDQSIYLIITGPATNLFQIGEGGITRFSLIRGDYTFKYWACGKMNLLPVHVVRNFKLRFTCDKPLNDKDR